MATYYIINSLVITIQLLPTWNWKSYRNISLWSTFLHVVYMTKETTSTYKNKDLFSLKCNELKALCQKFYSHSIFRHSFHRPTTTKFNQLQGSFLSFSNAAINMRTSYSLLIRFCVDYRFSSGLKDTRLCYSIKCLWDRYC